jgi:diazepam-binding inhibitor (GABA receptor modulating acyl-CoA-binding protein)
MVDSYSLVKYFDEVADKIKEHGKGMSSDHLALIYGLYKQAKLGDNNTEKPSFYQFEAKGKWEAWNSQKGKSADQAKHEYVEIALKYFPEELKAKYSK